MIFRYIANLCFPLVLTVISNSLSCEAANEAQHLNNTVFSFQNMHQCKRSEFYDLDIFACVSCSSDAADDEKLQTTANKFSCECTPNSMTVALFDSSRNGPVCAVKCETASQIEDNECQNEFTGNYTKINCKFKYVNTTAPNKSNTPASASKSILITSKNPHSADCDDCDLTYNFRYEDNYCIANALLKPYLKYNSFWQLTAASSHFGNLKFVAFFCLAMHNRTACNQLANLCIMSHFSLDKNSPCSVFLLTQASDVAIRYASMDEHWQVIRPYLFYKKGKQTTKLLAEPITTGAPYSLQGNDKNKPRNNRLQLFSMHYALDGTLQRWGRFKLNLVNLCQLHSWNRLDELGTQQEVRFGQRHAMHECKLTLENLIDLAQIYANNNFISLFLNLSNDKPVGAEGALLQAVPILIEDLTSENQRNHPEDWTLVKRFQLIATHPRHYYGSPKATYEDEHKLLNYRSLRFVEHFQLHYEIHDNNRISVPLAKLRYRNIELGSNNVTLDAIYGFKLEITFIRLGETAKGQTLLEAALPVLLIIAFVFAALRAYNFKRHRRTAVVAILGDTCDFPTCLIEFLLHLISNMANAFLCCFLLYTVYYSLQFLTQKSVEITLPIAKDQTSLEILIYAALMLKLIFLCVHFWRISHFDMFLIDWERPKSFDNNHFNLKNNLETSSVCSSVRTYISENNISTWRVFFTANEWIRLSAKPKTSMVVQGFATLIIFQLFTKHEIIQQDVLLQLFVIIMAYVLVYLFQLLIRAVLMDRVFGNPLQKFIDLCSLANISVLALLEQNCYGFYIHGRSPHGFADTDMYSMIMQLQRESQNMCSRRGLLSDSDQQSYIVLPPRNLRTYFEKLLIPFQRSCSISQAHFQKEITTVEGNMERTSVAYSSVNRFFCAFIDHAIKDMDYIIKEKSPIEKLFNCEFDNYLTENKGTFYIDNAYTFGQLFLYGNDVHIFVMEFLLVLSLYLLTTNLIIAIVVGCLLNKLFQCVFRNWVRQNVSAKTLIDKRFLM